MKLDNEYRIEKYSFGISLVKETEIQAIDKDTRKPIEGKTSISKEVFYLGNVEQCLRTYLRLQINACNQVSEILKAIEQTNKNITETFKNTKL